MNATLRSVFEDMLAMILQKHRVRFGELFWQGNRMAFEGREVLLQRRLWVMSFQPPAENNTKLFVESDHAGIEGSIVQAGQAQAISWVQSLSGKISPWLDMAGHQQARHVDAGNAAPNPIRIQERLTEKLLAASNTHRCRGLRGAGGQRQLWSGFQPDPVPFEKIHFAFIVVREEVVQHLLAHRAERGKVHLELIPQQPVLFRCAGKPFDSPCFEYWVERGKVTELHRKAVRCPSHLFGQFDDDGVIPVKFPKWQFAVQVEREKQVFARPFHSRSVCHVKRMPDSHLKLKHEKSTSGAPMSEPAFCIYIDTICEGPVPSVRDGAGKPYIFKTEVEAQREIADNAMTRLQEFIDGERDFDDAMTVEEYVVPVDVYPDGSIVDADGNHFGIESKSAVDA